VSASHWRIPTLPSPDHVELEPPVAECGHPEPAAHVGCIGLIVAPATEGHEVLEVEVRAALAMDAA